MSNINLDGGETSVIRALGFGGAPLMGSDLKARVGNLSESDLYGILRTLMDVGYVCANEEISSMEEIDRATFYTNPGYARELKEALDPGSVQERKPRRVRRE